MQAFYVTVNTVSEFKLAEPVIMVEDYVAVGGKRNCLVAYGNWKDAAMPPSAMVLKQVVNSASPLHSSIELLLCVCLWALLTLLP